MGELEKNGNEYENSGKEIYADGRDQVLGYLGPAHSDFLVQPQCFSLGRVGQFLTVLMIETINKILCSYLLNLGPKKAGF